MDASSIVGVYVLHFHTVAMVTGIIAVEKKNMPSWCCVPRLLNKKSKPEKKWIQLLLAYILHNLVSGRFMVWI